MSKPRVVKLNDLLLHHPPNKAVRPLGWSCDALPASRFPSMSKAVQPFNVKPAIPESIARSSKLLSWCQRQTEGYRNVRVTDLTMSWKSGLALCALIDRYRPDLMWADLKISFCMTVAAIAACVVKRNMTVSWESVFTSLLCLPHTLTWTNSPLNLTHTHTHAYKYTNNSPFVLSHYVRCPLEPTWQLTSYAIRGFAQPDLLPHVLSGEGRE